MAARTEPQTVVRTRLADRRTRSGLTQHALAERCGVSVAAYRRLERGQVGNPTLGLLVNCSIVLRCKLTDLLEDEWLRWHDL